MNNAINYVNEKIKLLKDKHIFEYMYLLGIFLYSFKFGFSSSLIIKLSSLTNMMLYRVSFLLMIPKVIFEKYDFKEKALLVLFVMLSFIFSISADSMSFLIIPFIIFGLKNINIRKVIMAVFVVTILFVCLHTTCYTIEYFANGGDIKNFLSLNRDDSIRSKMLCKANNNYAIMTVFGIIQYICLTNRNKNRTIKALGILLVSILVYSLCQSRTSLILSIIIFLYVLLEEKNFTCRTIKYLKYFAFIFVILFSFITPFIDISGNFASIINRLISGRLRECNVIDDVLGWSLLPNVINYNTLINFPVDNLVTRFIFYWGLVLSAIVIGVIFVFGFIKKTPIIIDFLIVLMCLWGLTECVPTMVTLPVLTLLLADNYLNKKYEN